MEKKNSQHLAEGVKEVAKRAGAVLVGVASIDRFDPLSPVNDRAPRGHHPKDFLPEARSVISIAMPILNPVMDAPAILATRNDLEMMPPEAKYPFMEVLYNRVGHIVHDQMLEFIGQLVGQYLMAEGYDAMIFPTTGLHPPVEGKTDKEIFEGPNDRWADKYNPLRYTYGPFSHRHAATRAGLGEFGYNNIVLTKQFGPRQRFNSIVTDADLLADPLLTEPICLRDECNLCLKACIVSCIYMRDDPKQPGYRSLESDNHSRIFIDTPAMTDPAICRRRREGIPESPVRGDCARVCPVPRIPRHLTPRLKVMVDEWLEEKGKKFANDSQRAKASAEALR